MALMKMKAPKGWRSYKLAYGRRRYKRSDLTVEFANGVYGASYMDAVSCRRHHVGYFDSLEAAIVALELL